jgi:hypothetical protein
MKKLFCFALLLVLAACNDKTTVVEPTGLAPDVLSVTLDTSQVNTSTLKPTGGNVTFSIGVSAAVQDSGVSGTTVSAYLLSPAGDATLATTSLTKSSGAYVGGLSVTLAQTALGKYAVAVVAQNGAGIGGISIRKPFIVFNAANQPPQLISAYISKDTVSVSLAQVADTLTFAAQATDPNGVADIAKIEAIRNGVALQLTNNGGGNFSQIFQVDTTNTTGLRTYTFQAIDRSGATSNTITKSFYINNPFHP